MGRALTFLAAGDDDTLARAALHAHATRVIALGEASGGQVMRDGKGAVWVFSTQPGAEQAIARPDFSGRDGDDRLDAVLEDFRGRRGFRGAGTWAPGRAVQKRLNLQLVARGFHWEGEGRAMVCDLSRLAKSWPVPEGVMITADDPDSTWDDHPHPYPHFDEHAREMVRVRSRAAEREPDRCRHFVAWLGGRPIGAATVQLAPGRVGAAGVFDVGVLPDCRGRGIGKAVTHAACEQGKRWGARFATLGASALGQPVYRRVGFRDIGPSYFWGFGFGSNGKRQATPWQVAVAYAAGRGDVDALAALATGRSKRDLDKPLPCGMTPLQLAGRAGKPRAARWLLERGVTPDLTALWRLGWRDAMAAAVRDDPSLLDAKSATIGHTPLHEAIMRDDRDLVRRLLDAGADPSIKDDTYDGDANGWAGHFGREAIKDILTQSRRGAKKNRN